MGKRHEERYVFDASAKTIKMPGNIMLGDLLLITNTTDGVIIFNFADPTKTATRSYSSSTDTDFPTAMDGVTTFTLSFDTTGMSDTDELNVYLEDEANGTKVRPYDFGTDAIERMRVANPQSLIDADFEYGLQQTKWQNLGLNNNIPSFYELPGPGLSVTDVVATAGSPYATITVSVASGAPAVGTPISAFGLSDPLAEGIFLVLTSNGSTSFTYQAKANISSGSLYTPYTVVKKGAAFSGTPMPINTMTGNGAGGLVTVTFQSAHGLVPGSPLTVGDSSGSPAHEGNFFVTQILNGTQLVYNAGQTVTNGVINTSTVSVYARNDSFFIHRPFDGGVLLGPFLPIHGLEAKRQSKRYFRYQSGKGIFFSTGALFNPIFDVQSVTYSNPDISITTQIEHGLQKGATIKLYGISSANYNGTYRVKSVTSDLVFTVEAAVAPTVTPAELEVQPRIAVVNWSGAVVRTGMFDDTNGIFWEYDGQQLFVVKRSSTFQLAGTVAVTSGLNTVTGTGTRFDTQIKVYDNITIRGQRYRVTGIASATSLTVAPEYRGSTVSGVKPTAIREIRVPQSKFNFDKIDGTGPSRWTINLAKMQMMALQWSWYGAGFVDFMVRGPKGQFIIAHRMPQNNINDEAYMRSGNLPARYEVINEGITNYLSSSSGTSGNLYLNDASTYPAASATYPEYVLLNSLQDGTQISEIVSYTGKDGNILTGTTRAASYIQFLAGSSRTFQGTATAVSHITGTSVLLMNTTCAPTISHWGSAVIMDGSFDQDTGYLFNIADFNISVAGNSTETILLFRPAPSVSNTISGNLGEREVLNRSIIQLVELEIQGDRSIEIAGVINPSNITGVTWVSASTQILGAATSVYQPSFAQYVSNANFTTAPTDGEVIFRYITPPSRANKSTFDLTKVKPLENGILGGSNTYPDGPEVLCLVVSNKEAQAASIDFSLKWTEAQA